MDMCTSRRDITEILLKTALNTIQSINQSINQSIFDRVKDIVGKGENAGYKYFSFPKNVFRRPLMIV